jgi:hypothetical protein
LKSRGAVLLAFLVRTMGSPAGAFLREYRVPLPGSATSLSLEVVDKKRTLYPLTTQVDAVEDRLRTD